MRHKDVNGVRTLSDPLPTLEGTGSEEDSSNTPTADLTAVAPDSQVGVGTDGPP